MKLFELIPDLLTEDINSKAEYLAKQLGDKLVDAYKKDESKEATAKEVMNQLKKADPSKQGLAMTFIANMYVKNQFKIEDIPRVKKDLDTFFKFRKEIENKDLNSYKKMDDLYDVTEKFQEKNPEMTKAAQEKVIKSGVKKLIDTKDFKALIPTTKEAACLYGANTKWCTAAEDNNMFDHYNDQGNLVIIIAGGKKFQLHFESDSFMNDRDQPLSKADIDYLSKYPEYKELLDMLIKKHYFDEE
jgi:hypothetical protein